MEAKAIQRTNTLGTLQEWKIEGEPFVETVKPFGNGARICCPSKYLNRKVLVVVLNE